MADHLSLETEVAVKFVSTDLSQNEDAKERFSREASASAKIKSPHVVQVFDHGETNGIPFIVMELLVGEDLSVKLEREGAMTIADLLPILRQVGKGLAMAHEAGVVHRDIKPANIFLTKPDGELFVKLLDFGIAKSGTRAHPSVTNAGDTLGTPYYMSPEQLFTPEDVDFRSDLWALAVVVYEALSGDLPYDGETIGVINVAIASGNYKPLTLRCPGMPASADEWFRRAFHKDRNKRFLSAKELVDAFAVSFPADSRASTSKTNSKDYFPLASDPPPNTGYLLGSQHLQTNQVSPALPPSGQWQQQPSFARPQGQYDPKNAHGLQPSAPHLHQGRATQPRAISPNRPAGPQGEDASKGLVRAIIKGMIVFFCISFLIGCALIGIKMILRANP